MKKLLMIFAFVLGITSSYANDDNRCYVYGVDFSHARVYAAEESVEQFANAFKAINLLFITEPEKYDFSLIMNKRVSVVVEPVMNIISACDYSGLKTYDNTYANPDYSAIIKNYTLSQTEGTGIVMIAKMLDKPMRQAVYELITFDIASREILSKREVKGKAGGFGLRNFWAGSIYQVIKNTRL